MTIAGTQSSIQRFKSRNSVKFEMEDLGEVTKILGMTITRDWQSRILSLSQQGYVDNFLKSYDMSDCKLVAPSMEPGTHLLTATEDEFAEFAVSGNNYRRAVDSLNYLVQCSRPDLAFASSQISQYLYKPGTKHWAAFWRILRYLSGTSNYSITFQGDTQSKHQHIRQQAVPDKSCWRGLGWWSHLTTFHNRLRLCTAWVGNQLDVTQTTHGWPILEWTGVQSYCRSREGTGLDSNHLWRLSDCCSDCYANSQQQSRCHSPCW